MATPSYLSPALPEGTSMASDALFLQEEDQFATPSGVPFSSDGTEEPQLLPDISETDPYSGVQAGQGDGMEVPSMEGFVDGLGNYGASSETPPQLELELPKYKEQGPPRPDDPQGMAAFEENVKANEGALARYERRKREQEEYEKNYSVAREMAFELAKQIPAGMYGVAAATSLLNKEAQRKAKEEAFQQDFGWLNGNEYPTLKEFLDENYPDYNKLKPEELDQVYTYWSDNATKYYAGYKGSDENEVAATLEQIMIENPKLLEAKKQGLIKQFKDTGYNVPNSPDFEPLLDTGFRGFDVTMGGLFTARAMKDAQAKFNAWQDLKTKYPDLVDDNGNLNKPLYDSIRNQNLQEKLKRFEQFPTGASFAEFSQTLPKDNFDLLGEDPIEATKQAIKATKILGDLSAVHSTVSESNTSTADFMRAVAGLKRVPDPLTGVNTYKKMTATERALAILSGITDAVPYVIGQNTAQQLDMMDAQLAAKVVTVAGAATANPLGVGAGLVAGGTISAIAEGDQEARLVAVDLFKEAMAKGGYDIGNVNDWEKAKRDGYLDRYIQEADRKGLIKGLTTAGVSGIINEAIDLGLKRVPFLKTAVDASKNLAFKKAAGRSLSRIVGTGFAEGAGEAAGELAAYNEINTGDVAVESLLGMVGSANQQVARPLLQYGTNKIFGKPDDGATPPGEATDSAAGKPTTPTPATPRGPAPNQPVTKADAINSLEAEILGQEPPDTAAAPPVEEQPPVIETAPADANAARQPGTALATIPPLGETPATAPDQPRVALPRGEGVSSMADLGTPMGDVMTDFGPLRTEPTPTVEPLTAEPPPAQPELAMPTVLSPREQFEANLIAQLSPAERRLRIAENLKKTFPDTYDLIERIEQARSDSDVKEDDPFGIEEVNALIDLAIRIDEEIKSQQPKAAAQPQKMPTVEDIAASSAKAKRNVDLEGFRNRVRAEAAAQAGQPTPALEGEVALTPQELSDSFREEQKTLPEKSQAAWTEQDYATADQYFQTGDEALLEGLNKVKQNRIRSHRFFVAEDRRKEAQARRSQGGFIDIAGIGQGVTETAIKLWNGTKNFAEWSGQMIENYGQRISQYLRDIWSRINGLAKTARQYLPSQQQRPAEPGARRFSTPTEKDIKKAFAEAAEQSAAETQSRVQTFFGGKTPDNVGFINDIMLPFTASISGLKNGRPFVTVNLAYANPQNIEAALYEEIGHYAAEKGMLKNFYASLDPTEKADVEAAVATYGESEARQAKLSVDALQAEEREAKSFAAIATRNKGLWQRIKEFVNRILTDLGLSKASTDQQVADIFLKAMNAFLNEKEGAVDLSDRSVYYNLPARKGKLQKMAEKIDQSKSGPIRALLTKINISALGKADRKALSDFLRDTAKEADDYLTKGIAVSRSKDYFDRVMAELRGFKEKSIKREFEKLQRKYPNSLKGLTFDSVDTATGSPLFPGKTKKEVLAYVASLPTEEGNVLNQSLKEAEAERTIKKEAAKQQKQEQEGLALGESITLALDAQSKIPQIVKSELFQNIKRESEDDALNILKAFKYLKNINPETQSKRANERLAATIDSAIDGRFMGFGKYTVAYMLDEFKQKLDALIQAEGGVAFWEREGRIAKALLAVTEAYLKGARKTFKKETVEALLFSHPVLKDLWISTFGDYLDTTQTKSSSLQLYFKESLEEILERHGLARKSLIGKAKDRDPDIFSTAVEKEKEEIYMAAQITQWSEGSEDPLAEIQKVISDMISGFDQLERNGSFMETKAKSSRDTLMKTLLPALNDGILIPIDADNGLYEITVPPDVWSEYILGNLKNNQRDALLEIRNLAGELEPRLRFTQEFWYNKPWEGIVNYIPRSAADVTPQEKTEGPDLNSNGNIQSSSDPAMVVHGSVLHGRKGLGPGQYYRTDLETGLMHAFNSASYEVTTAGQRAVLHEVLKEHKDRTRDSQFLPFFGSSDRRKAIREMYKELHKAELKRDIAERQPQKTFSLFFNSIIDELSNAVYQDLVGTFKNLPAQYIAPMAGGVVFAGPSNIFEAKAIVSSWSDEKTKAFFRKTIPDIISRADINNILLDRNANSDMLATIAAIDYKKLENVSPEDRKLIIAARLKVGISKVAFEPKKALTKEFTSRPDALAAAHLFPGLMAKRLIEAGLIQKPSELTMEIALSPAAERALADARRDLSNITGVPGRYALRPTMFVDKSNTYQNILVKAIYSLMQIATTFAGDTVLNIRDMSYFNKKDKYAGKIRSDAWLRSRALVAQNVTFKGISVMFGGLITSLLVTGFSKAEFDEDEEKWNEQKKKLRENIKVQGWKAVKQAILETAFMAGGPIGSNSVSMALADVGTRRAIAALVEEEYKLYTDDLREQIKRAGRGTSKEADLKLELEEAKSLYKEVNVFFAKEAMGPIYGAAKSLVEGRYSYDEAEYARIAQRYYEAGGPIKEPDPNWASIYLRKAISFVVPDVLRVSRDISKTKQTVARLRQEKLDEMEKRGATRVRPIASPPLFQ